MFSLSKENSNYKTVVFDVIRIFNGEYKWEDLNNNIFPEILILEKDFQIIVNIEDFSNAELLKDLSENNKKRVIKKLLYILLKENYINLSDSWGILTGIRPTKIVHRMIDQGLDNQGIINELGENYLLKNDKAELLVEVTEKQREYFLTIDEMYKNAAIYISIPFCPSICTYCTFGSYLLNKNKHLLERYLENLFFEFETVLNKMRDKGLIPDKIYIGGGTPSILNEDQLEKLLIKIQNNIKLENVTEFSFEGGRPDTLSTKKFDLLKKYGVNRISINPQIMKDNTLRKLGRTHFSEDIKRSFNEARKTGFEVINMDLIMGIEENNQDFFDSLEQIIDLSPENITIHSLAFKRKSALNIDDKLIHSQERTDLFNEGLKRLRKAGYEPYYLYKQKLTAGGQENIGFARDKKFSSYNIQMIEERQSIFGFGVGASSKFVNPRDLTLENVFNPKDLYYYNDKLEEVIKKKTDFIEKLSKEYKYGN